MKTTFTATVRRLACVGLMIIATGCQTVTIRPDGGFKMAAAPAFQERQDFYLWGLVGESHIDTGKICPKAGPSQMQSQTTVVDGLLGLITLGIYSPETAKVWCK